MPPVQPRSDSDDYKGDDAKGMFYGCFWKTNKYTYIHTSIHIYMYICIYIYMYTFIYTYLYLNI